jgi:hypothetical protein
LRNLAVELEFYFATHAGERAQMMREDNTDHKIKCQWPRPKLQTNPKSQNRKIPNKSNHAWFGI